MTEPQPKPLSDELITPEAVLFYGAQPELFRGLDPAELATQLRGLAVAAQAAQAGVDVYQDHSNSAQTRRAVPLLTETSQWGAHA